MPRMVQGASFDKKNKLLIICGVLLLAAMMSGWQLEAKSIGEHESYVALTAREMLDSGDWIIPRCNGQLRLEKTPLCYWLTAIAGKIRGAVDETAVRIPSVFIAILLTAAILYFVSEWFGFSAAVMAALIWVTSLCFVRYSSSGRPEMALTSFTAISLMAFYTGINTTQRKRQIGYMLIFWLSFALAMLAKGPAPLPFVSIPIFLYILIWRRWKQIPQMLPVLGLLIFLIIVLAWPVMVAFKMQESTGQNAVIGCMDFWKKEFIGRFMGTYASCDKPAYYYISHIFGFMVPWVAFVPMALAAPFYKVWNKRRIGMLFLWIWFVSNVVFMSISGGKRMHYILPAMPAIAILIGVIVNDMLFERKAYTKRFAKNLFLLHVGAAVAAAIVAPIYIAKNQPAVLPQCIVLAVGTIIVTVLTLTLFAKNRPVYGWASICVGYCILIMIAYSTIALPRSSTRFARKFALDVKNQIPQNENLIAYERITMRFVFYFGRIVPIVEDKEQLYQRYQQGDWVVATGEYFDELIKDGRFEIKRQWDATLRHNTKGAVFLKELEGV